MIPQLPHLATAWVLTYLLHSTLLLALACLAGRWLARRSLALEETVWRAALFGALATATLQVAIGGSPLGRSWALPAAERQAAAAAVTFAAQPLELGAGGAAAAAVAGERSAARGNEAPRAAGAAAFSASPASASEALASESNTREASLLQRQAASRAEPVNGRGQAFGAGSPASAAPSPLSWPALLLALWAAGTAVLLARLAASYLLLRRCLHGRAEVSGGVAFRLLAHIATATRVRQARLTCAPHLPVPVAMGVRRPEIALPPRALAELDAEELAGLLAHELGHIARRDPAWLLLGQLVAAVAFLQPLNRVALRRLRELSELACDEWSVRRTGSALSLARCLAEVARWSLPAGRRARLLPAPGMVGRPSQLARRIRRLLDGAAPAERRVRTGWLVGSLALLLVAVVAAAPGVSARGLDEDETAVTAAQEPAEATEAEEAQASEDAAASEEVAEPEEGLVPEEPLELAEALAAAPADWDVTYDFGLEVPDPAEAPPSPPTPEDSLAPPTPEAWPAPMAAPVPAAPPAPAPPGTPTSARPTPHPRLGAVPHAGPLPTTTPPPPAAPRPGAIRPNGRPPAAAPAPPAPPTPRPGARPPRAPRSHYERSDHHRLTEIDRLAEQIGREAEAIARQLEPAIENLAAEIEWITERHVEEIAERVARVVELHAERLAIDLEHVSEQAARARRLSDEDRKRVEEVTRRLAEKARPTAAEMEALRQALEANEDAIHAVTDGVLRGVEDALQSLERELERLDLDRLERSGEIHRKLERKRREPRRLEAEEEDEAAPAPEPPRR